MAMVLLYMLIVIGVFFLVIRLVAKRGRYGQAGKTIRSLGGTQLGQNKSVQIVEVGGVFYILGVGENVTLIAKVEDPAEAEEIRMSTERPYKGSDSFPTVSEWLKSLSRRKPSEPDPEENFGQIFQDRMVAMANRRKSVEEWIDEDTSSTDRDDRQGKKDV